MLAALPRITASQTRRVVIALVLLFGLGLGVVACVGVMLRQDRLDDQLVESLLTGDSQTAIRLIARGANPNIRTTFDPQFDDDPADIIHIVSLGRYWLTG